MKIKNESPDQSSVPGEFPFKKTKCLMSEAELQFFDVLKEAIAQQAYIFVKVRLADVMYVESTNPDRQKWFNKIRAKHLDFVICDRSTVEPVLAIELADEVCSPSNDTTKFAALISAGLPVLRLTRGGHHDAGQLAALIAQTIDEHAADTAEDEKTHQ